MLKKRKRRTIVNTRPTDSVVYGDNEKVVFTYPAEIILYLEEKITNTSNHGFIKTAKIERKIPENLLEKISDYFIGEDPENHLFVFICDENIAPLLKEFVSKDEMPCVVVVPDYSEGSIIKKDKYIVGFKRFIEI